MTLAYSSSAAWEHSFQSHSSDEVTRFLKSSKLKAVSCLAEYMLSHSVCCPVWLCNAVCLLEAVSHEEASWKIGLKDCESQRVWRTAVEWWLLARTWPLHPWTTASYGCLHMCSLKSSQATFQHDRGRGYLGSTPSWEVIGSWWLLEKYHFSLGMWLAIGFLYAREWLHTPLQVSSTDYIKCAVNKAMKDNEVEGDNMQRGFGRVG